MPVGPEYKEKKAVITPFGLYEFISILFGLKNARVTFQRIMDSIFKTFPFLYTYLEDSIVFSSSGEKHEAHLKTAFKLLEENFQDFSTKMEILQVFPHVFVLQHILRWTFSSYRKEV